MANSGIKSTVLAASTAFLISPVTVQAANTYTISTNLLSWDESNSYLLTDIASAFGKISESADNLSAAFQCGRAMIPVFDFGLLLSCFRAMVAAKTELGDSLPTSSADTTVPQIDVAWFCNYGVLHSIHDNLLVTITSADIQNACSFKPVVLQNFVDVRT